MFNHRSLKLLFYAYSTSTLSLGILNPIYGFFIKEIGGGVVETTISVALFSFVAGIVTIALYKAAWSKPFRRGFLVWGWFLWLISLIMFCMLTAISTVFIAQIIGGFGTALSQSSFEAEFATRSEKEQPLLGGVFEGVMRIISAVSTVIGGLAIHWCGLHFLMLSMAAIASLSFVIIFYYGYVKKYAPSNK